MVKKIALLVFLLHALYLHAGDFPCGDPIVDSRDQQEYGTVLIGTQCWMAENLNFGQMVPDMNQQKNNTVEKSCYENNSENCAIYGGLYTWDEMMNGEEESDICPDGWHIPSLKEWEELNNYLGEKDAGQKMKATKNDPVSWDGNNSSGFTAIPAGVAYENYFGRINQWAIFWTSTGENEEYAWFAQLDNFWYPEPPKYKKLYLGNYYLKKNGFSVRCIKNK